MKHSFMNKPSDKIHWTFKSSNIHLQCNRPQIAHVRRPMNMPSAISSTDHGLSISSPTSLLQCVPRGAAGWIHVHVSAWRLKRLMDCNSPGLLTSLIWASVQSISAARSPHQHVLKNIHSVDILSVGWQNLQTRENRSWFYINWDCN